MKSFVNDGAKIIEDDDDNDEELEVMVMEKELYQAALGGQISFLAHEYNDEYFLRKTSLENNIIHIAVRQGQSDFVREAGRRFPELVCEGNCDNNTPLHFAAESGNLSIVELLVSSYKTAYNDHNKPSKVPWRMKNKEGNTPLHMALIHVELKVAEFLVEEDPMLTRFRNNLKQTPLHLAVKHHFDDAKKSVVEEMKLLMEVEGKFLTTEDYPKFKEASSSMIELLLRKNKSVACWRDTNGMTPLLQAASRNPPCLLAIRAILDQCPQSAEVSHSTSGDTLLHLLIKKHPNKVEIRELMSNPEILALKDCQDFVGNTPAHIVVRNQDVDMAVWLLSLSVNISIKNKEGLSVVDLIQQQRDFKGRLTKKVFQRLEVGNVMKHDQIDGFDDYFDLIRSFRGNKDNISLARRILKKSGRDILLTRSAEDYCNILHVLYKKRFHGAYDEESKYEDNKLVNEALEILPSMICQTNQVGQTPLHIIAELPELIDKSLLEKYKEYFGRAQEEVGTQELYSPPWRAKDRDGNTPLHLLLLPKVNKYHYDPDQLISNAKALLEFDPELAGYRNNNGQVPIHLLCLHWFPLGEDEVRHEVSRNIIFIIQANNSEARFMRDNEGLTPLQIAFKSHNFVIAEMLLHVENVLEEESNCRNEGSMLHLIADKEISEKDDIRLEYIIKRFLVAYTPFFTKDNDGNTALHLAIERGHFRFAQLLIALGACISFYDGRNLLEVRNNKNVSPGDLIGSLQHLPYEFEQFLWSSPMIVEQMLGYRSFIGIPTTMIKDYNNTLGVTAALLATITFTAAFAVPGGLNSNNGTPLLMRSAAFQVFMVSDILAMCLSMMVLFCLLWMMTLNDRKTTVVLLDLTVFLLEASFYATLLTFMTGLYVTTFPITPWIAILACALCSLLILLMRKRFIIGLIPGLIRIVVWSRKVYFSVREFILLTVLFIHILCCTKQNTARSNNNNSGQPTEPIRTQQQPQETANEQPDSDAKAIVVEPPSDAKESLTESPPNSVHTITIEGNLEGSKDDGGFTSGSKDDGDSTSGVR